MALCLDVSNWDRSTFDADCLHAQGVESIILGCQDPVAAEWMAAEAVRAGIRIRATYGMNYFTPGPNVGNGDMYDCVDISRHYGVRRVWIDCEIDAAPDNVADRNSEVSDCESLVETAGLQAGIYTAPWWWVPNHGNTTAFAHLPLWFSNYGANDGALPPIRYLGFLSFGGWTECVMHQYTSTMWLCGRKRDANYVFEDGDDEMGMTAEEKADFAKLVGEHEQLKNLVGAWGYEQDGVVLKGASALDAMATVGVSIGLSLQHHDAALTRIATAVAEFAHSGDSGALDQLAEDLIAAGQALKGEGK